jgi:hypothetical protein
MKASAKKMLNAAPVIRYLSDPSIFTDNKLDQAMEQLGFNRLLNWAGFRKQKGDPLVQVMFALMIWPLLEVRSLSSFCGKFIKAFIAGGMSVLYDFQKRQDLNWRKLRQLSAKQVYWINKLHQEKNKAFVFDDSLKGRRGKHVAATSSHFDHTTNRHIRGQQLLEMGLVSPKGYLPLDSQIYIGDKNRTKKQPVFKNSLLAVARDYFCALNQNKNQMLRQMIKRANRLGIKADFVLGDAWYGNRGNIEAVLKARHTAIFRMKNSGLKYRINGKEYTAQAIYCLNRFHCEKLNNQPWKTFSIPVELNLEENPNKTPKWTQVQLVFVTPKAGHKKEFALFLCTDTTLGLETILETYSLRWSIEVYFKEVKQYLGLLKEQTGDYACHYASVHLAAIRYLLLSHMLMTEGDGFLGKIRDHVTKSLQLLSFATLLWELFKALIFGTLDQLKALLGDDILQTVKAAIDSTVTEFLSKALQIDPDSLLHEKRAVKAGVI